MNPVQKVLPDFNQNKRQVYARLTKRWQVFDRNLLAGRVEGNSGHLQGLVGFLELLAWVHRGSRYHR